MSKADILSKMIEAANNGDKTTYDACVCELLIIALKS